MLGFALLLDWSRCRLLLHRSLLLGSWNLRLCLGVLMRDFCLGSRNHFTLLFERFSSRDPTGQQALAMKPWGDEADKERKSEDECPKLPGRL